jgi:hypothetical protein
MCRTVLFADRERWEWAGLSKYMCYFLVSRYHEVWDFVASAKPTGPPTGESCCREKEGHGGRHALPYQINYLSIRKSLTAIAVNRSFALHRYTDRASGCSANSTRMPLAVETGSVKCPASEADNYLRPVHVRGVDTGAWGQWSHPVLLASSPN